MVKGLLESQEMVNVENNPKKMRVLEAGEKQLMIETHGNWSWRRPGSCMDRRGSGGSVEDFEVFWHVRHSVTSRKTWLLTDYIPHQTYGHL